MQFIRIFRSAKAPFSLAVSIGRSIRQSVGPSVETTLASSTHYCVFRIWLIYKTFLIQMKIEPLLSSDLSHAKENYTLFVKRA